MNNLTKKIGGKRSKSKSKSKSRSRSTSRSTSRSISSNVSSLSNASLDQHHIDVVTEEMKHLAEGLKNYKDRKETASSKKPTGKFRIVTSASAEFFKHNPEPKKISKPIKKVPYAFPTSEDPHSENKTYLNRQKRKFTNIPQPPERSEYSVRIFPNKSADSSPAYAHAHESVSSLSRSSHKK